MGLGLFDLGAGLVLLVSVIVGWIRGGAREVATVAAIIIAAIVGLFALHWTGGIAQSAIHTPWLANIVAILIVFVAVYILLRVAASALIRRIHQTSLGGVDRAVGVGFGLVRALVILGLANLTLNAVIPPERMPTWISQAFLYPVSAVSADVLKAFAPQGARLAGQVAPVVGKAITGGAEDNSAQAPAAQNRGYTSPSSNAAGPRETSR
jgi:membrane protein required for colicin V production